MKKIVLFYKKLLEPGGAERLLLNEYHEFKALGYAVNILGFRISQDALFQEEICSEDICELGDDSWILSLAHFVRYIQKNRDAYYLCASGHIEMYIASLLTGINYSLHIHHPSFMSFNETDKYSLFQKKHFQAMLKSNFGASRFEVIKNNLSWKQKFYINLRAILSIASIKHSLHNFVLSSYAQKEKKILFGVESHVLCGALDDSIFTYVPSKDFSLYENYTYKLLTIARLDENKRIDELLKAFALFLEREPNSILFIGGKGPEKSNLESLAHELNIHEHVVFLGFIPDNELFDYYAMADAFVSIDWADYRITMYESLAMNTKVLLSNETDADEFLLNSHYLYVTQPDSSHCYDALQQVLKNEPSISFTELKSYLKKFTWQSYCKEIAKILSKND